ncbi:MAG: tRNA 2-selenouridine(34) synthase MnmH [Cyanobium sp. LacPavin_0920_WC12_MAG_62_9]|nr:tRNA 2-selenouridine(34) synthase MnmH [Cyanobium sp. LacPavin_0920_WC12_MAG_62_9]
MQAEGQRLPIQDFLELGSPIVDVRSPGEYQQGHIPGAHNLPLFSDAERAAVGTTYKQLGRQSAVQLGLEFVGPKLASMAAALQAIADPGRDGHAMGTCSGKTPLAIHCWRGGMRSASVAWLAGTLDLPVVLLEGGYKRFRHWVLAEMEKPRPLLVLGGRTGTGKTDLLLELHGRGAAVVDLEGLANHRGSSFGGLGLPPQPSNEHYENLLAFALRQCPSPGPLWLEAESAQVGRCRIPAGLWAQMGQAPAIEIQRPMEERVERLVAVYGELGQQSLREATERIARRLGPQRTALALAAIDQGDWAEACRQMLDYYDRCYDHDLGRRSQPPLRQVDLTGLNEAEAAALLLKEANREARQL